MEALTHVWGLKTGGPSEKLVAACLADHATKDWESWPSIARIAERTDMSERCVRYALRKLEERGIISTRLNHTGRGSNRYVLNRDTGANLAGGQILPGASVAPEGGKDCRGTGANNVSDGGKACPLTIIEPPFRTPNEPPKANVTRKKKAATSPDYSADFNRLYEIHPKKKDKAAGFEAFNAIQDKPGIEELCDLLRAEIIREGINWTKEGGQYCPSLGPWLRKRRWDDLPNGGRKMSIEDQQAYVKSMQGEL